MSAVVAAVALFGGSFTVGTASPAPFGSASAAPGAGACTIAPSLWASDGDFFGAVTGYGGPNMVPMCVIGVPASGWPFLVASMALATDNAGTLYVADSGNHRIVEYTKTGALITTFTTDVGGTAHVPLGICVSPKNLVAVATTQPSWSNGNVEVFKSGALVASAATSNLAVGNYCAFDRAGNLFVDGNGYSGGGFIWYLTRLQLNTIGGTLALSNAGSGGWLGMYSRNTNDETLSVASVPHSGSGCSYCVSVKTWAISNAPSGGLTLTQQSTCSITGYPGLQSETVRQIAPSASGDLYIADWLDHKIEHTGPCANNASLAASTLNPAIIPASVAITRPNILGGNVTLPAQLYWGVATYPTGQY